MNTIVARTLQLLSLSLIPVSLTVGLVPPAYGAEASEAIAYGTVVDEQGRPLNGVLLAQQGALASVFSQRDGSFRLKLEGSAPRALVVSAVGYETSTVTVTRTGPQVICLKALKSFIPSQASVDAEAPLGRSNGYVAPLNSGLILAYRFRSQLVSDGSATIQGLGNNDYRMGFRLRLKPWLFEAEGAHFQTPVDVSGLAREDNPAFSPSTWQLGLRAGPIWSFGEQVDVALGAGYRWTNTVPNNRNVAYTGSDLDFEQTRHAFGGVLTTAWHPIGSLWHLEGMLGIYPLLAASADAPGLPFANSLLTDARGLVGYEVSKGLRLGAGVQFDRWSGRGEDRSWLYSLQLHYTPGGLPAGETP